MRVRKEWGLTCEYNQSLDTVVVVSNQVIGRKTMCVVPSKSNRGDRGMGESRDSSVFSSSEERTRVEEEGPEEDGEY